jgi:alkylation response protein AidB-like acyl-CoA dehydrogenase
MDFSFSKPEEKFREELRDWITDELKNQPVINGVNSEESWQFNLEIRRKLAEKGWLTMAWPKEYGGQGASHMMQVIFSEEMSYRECPGRDVFGTKMMAPTVMIHGSDEQKKEFLPPVARGEVQWCQGYSEPESGSDLASIQTRAVEDGDDFIVNGTKIWTSSADRADHIMLLTRTDPDAPKHRGISFLLGDMSTPGITVDPIINMAGDHVFNMVTFENVRIPKKNLVGEQNRGWYVGATLLDFERSGVDYPAEARRTLEELVGFSKMNHRNGTLISEDPVMRHRFADLAIAVEVCKLISYNIAWMQGQGMVPNKEASMGKVMGTELQQQVSTLGMKMLGLHGQLEKDSKYAPLQGKIEHAHLSNVSQTILAGTSEINRNIIATRGLGLPRG